MCNRIQARYSLAIMVFSGTFITYLLRTNISITLIAMVRQHESVMVNNNACDVTNGTIANYYAGTTSENRTDDLYDWSECVQAQILAAYFLGYVFSTIPGRWLQRKYGAKWIVGVTTLVGGILTALTPAMARTHSLLVVCNRMLLGICGGFLFPGLHICVSLWTPQENVELFSWCLIGGTIGTIVFWPTSALLIMLVGWEFVFYISGALAIIWSIMWLLFMYDAPAKHPRISDTEKSFIIQSVGVFELPQDTTIPWRSMMLSAPFYSLTILLFANTWNMNFLLIIGPRYLIQVLNFSYLSGSILAVIPLTLRMITGYATNICLQRVVLSKNMANKWTIRRVATMTSHLIPGLMLLWVSNIDCNISLTVVLFILAIGLNGVVVCGALANTRDLSPKYSRKLFNLLNCITMTSGIIVPEIVSLHSLFHEKLMIMKYWQLVILTNASLYISSSILFLIFGSAEVQPWNEMEPDEEDEKPQDDDSNTNQEVKLQLTSQRVTTVEGIKS